MPDRPDDTEPLDTSIEGDVMAGDRRIARADNALPDWEMPDASYRPVPIVWFTTALLMQVFGQLIVAVLVAGVLGLSATICAAFALLVTGLIGFGTWERGMGRASRGWRIATVAMLCVTLAFAVLAIFGAR